MNAAGWLRGGPSGQPSSPESYIVKLRGRPKGSATKQGWKRLCGQANDLWYGKNADHEPGGEMDNPQPSPKVPRSYRMQFTD